MSMENFISEIEASKLAAVSGQTLIRFAEAGYLRVDVRSDGEKAFLKDEIVDLFGLEERKDIPVRKSPTPNFTRFAPLSSELDNLESSADETIIDIQLASEPSPLATEEPSPTKRGAIQFLEQEIQRLRSSLHLREKELELRESELRSLREDRDWLRNRVERLEDQSEREQLLLMANAQNLRKLIGTVDQKKRPMRAALEWLGFVAPPQKDQQE